MKINKVSDHIWSMKQWVGIPIHVWLVVDKDGVTLVDAGMSMMAPSILAEIEKLDAGPLQRILLTHGHADHVGALDNILSETTVPVYAHSLEIPYMEGRLPYPGRKKAEYNVPKGLAQELKVDEEDALQKISGLTPYHTPGHSPGHVVYYHEQDQVLLAGDLFTSKRGKLNKPMPAFTADMAEAVRSSDIVEKLNPDKLVVCHGSLIHQPAKQLSAYRKKMVKFTKQKQHL